MKEPPEQRKRHCTKEEQGRALQDLDTAPRRVRAADWPGNLTGLEHPGLYSWWVDEAGARDLSEGLGLILASERIYAGQAGATAWPSGRRSTATLRSRIATNHLGGTTRGSTFRLTLAATLRESLGLEPRGTRKLQPASERRLTAWMRERLEVAVHAYPNADALEDLKRRVLALLDPPLNLDGMPRTPIRTRLSELRAVLT